MLIIMGRDPPHGRSCQRGKLPGDIAIVHSNTRKMLLGSRLSLFGERKFKWRGRSAFVAFLRGLAKAGPPLAALSMIAACAPKVSAGEWQCSNGGGTSDGGTPHVPSPTDPVTLPWAARFEENFCDYEKVAGFCYGDQPYVSVTEPHHSGRFAAAFKVIGAEMHQTRCVRQGVFPESAYYGAWYFIPEALKDVEVVWNLWHFQARDTVDEPHYDLWDINLVKGAQAGDWELEIYDRLAPPNANTYRSAEHRPIPFGRWFHIALFLKRAADSSGKVVLYQDGVQLFEQTNLKSDVSKLTQWYVGNWAEKATPEDSTLYVDDVSIGATLSAVIATQ
jgi:hypothetical protein